MLVGEFIVLAYEAESTRDDCLIKGGRRCIAMASRRERQARPRSHFAASARIASRPDGDPPPHRRGRGETEVVGSLPEHRDAAVGVDRRELGSIRPVESSRAGGTELQLLTGSQDAREPQRDPAHRDLWSGHRRVVERHGPEVLQVAHHLAPGGRSLNHTPSEATCPFWSTSR